MINFERISLQKCPPIQLVVKSHFQRNYRCLFVFQFLLLAKVCMCSELVVGVGQHFTNITAAVSAAKFGDTIVVHEGLYTEKLLINRGITIVNNSTNRPVISGPITISANNVIVSGLEITNWTTEGTLGFGIYAYNVTNILITNCWVHHNLKYGSSAAIYCRKCAQLTIVSNRLNNACKGINITSAFSPNNTYSNGITIVGNAIYNNYNDGIDIHGQYITIAKNTIYNNMDTNAPITHPDGIQFIEGTVDGKSAVQEAKVFGNTIYNHNQGIFVESRLTNAPKCTNVWIYNNVVYTTKEIVNGQDMNTFANTLIVILGPCNVFICNNYLERANTLIAIRNPTVPGTVTVKNNVFRQTRQNAGGCLWLDETNIISTGDCNNNVYSSPSGQWIVTWGNNTFYDVNALFKSTGQENLGFAGDPLLNSAPFPNPLPGSVCLNSGANLSSMFGTDFLDVARPKVGLWTRGPIEKPNQPLTPPSNLKFIP